MKPLSEYTRSALELSEKTTEKLRRSTHAALAKTEKIRRPSTGIDKKRDGGWWPGKHRPDTWRRRLAFLGKNAVGLGNNSGRCYFLPVKSQSS